MMCAPSHSVPHTRALGHLFRPLMLLAFLFCCQRLEQRPLFDFSHKYAPELSGPAVPPDQLESSRPALQLSLHPTGGLSGVSTTLPLPQNMESETFLPRASNGLNAQYQERIHVVAAEPHTTFLCISATDRGQEVACATAVIGRLRRGYRVLQMRSPTFGTRIELCFLFLRIEFSFESNLWPTPRQVRRDWGCTGTKSTQNKRDIPLRSSPADARPEHEECTRTADAEARVQVEHQTIVG
jgi:hypothetical protein